MVGGAQQSHRGPRILQRLVVFRLRDVEIPDDGQLADEAQPSGNEDSSLAKKASKKRIRGAKPLNRDHKN